MKPSYCDTDNNSILRNIIEDLIYEQNGSYKVKYNYILNCIEHKCFKRLAKFIKTIDSSIDIYTFGEELSYSYIDKIYEFIKADKTYINLFHDDFSTQSYLFELSFRKNDKELLGVLFKRNGSEIFKIQDAYVLSYRYHHRHLWNHICNPINIKAMHILIDINIITLSDFFEVFIINNHYNYLALDNFDDTIGIFFHFFFLYQLKFSDIKKEVRYEFICFIGKIIKRYNEKYYKQNEFDWTNTLMMFITSGYDITENEFKTIICYDEYDRAKPDTINAFKFLIDQFHSQYEKKV